MNMVFEENGVVKAGGCPVGTVGTAGTFLSGTLTKRELAQLLINAIADQGVTLGRCYWQFLARCGIYRVFSGENKGPDYTARYELFAGERFLYGFSSIGDLWAYLGEYQAEMEVEGDILEPPHVVDTIDGQYGPASLMVAGGSPAHSWVPS
jgi:hypothetical protein